MAELDAATRNALSASDFALPSTRSYPIHDLSHARYALDQASGRPEEATVKAAVYKRYPALAQTAKCEIVVPIWKHDAAQIVYGVVLTPGVTDSQGDDASAQEIEKAAHRYLVESRKHDVQHSGTPADVNTVESYIAPQDLTLFGQKVLKGSWVMATHIADPDVWQRVQKDDLTGYSIAGTAIREVLA
jgi:hypothetical protein